MLAIIYLICWRLEVYVLYMLDVGSMLYYVGCWKYALLCWMLEVCFICWMLEVYMLYMFMLEIYMLFMLDVGSIYALYVKNNLHLFLRVQLCFNVIFKNILLMFIFRLFLY